MCVGEYLIIMQISDSLESKSRNLNEMHLEDALKLQGNAVRALDTKKLLYQKLRIVNCDVNIQKNRGTVSFKFHFKNIY